MATTASTVLTIRIVENMVTMVTRYRDVRELDVG
jgi:hypothetical protein